MAIKKSSPKITRTARNAAHPTLKGGKKNRAQAAKRVPTLPAPSDAREVAPSLTAVDQDAGAHGPHPARDPRLPEAGTVLRKLDRLGNLRCECTVVSDGVEYRGKVFKSLSAAAVAAASDLDIKGAQNGYVFWGLVKPSRPGGQNPLQRLEKSWERYAACARSILAGAAGDDRATLLAAVERHQSTNVIADDAAAA